MDVPCALSMLLTEGDWDPIVKIVCKQTDINTVNRCESRPLTLFVIFLFTQFSRTNSSTVQNGKNLEQMVRKSSGLKC